MISETVNELFENKLREDESPPRYLGSCQECGAPVVEAAGAIGGTLYEGIKCPNGCNLWAQYM